MTTNNPVSRRSTTIAVRRHAIRALLRDVFAIERLREGQLQVIDSVLDGKDTLAIMPTGGGKSLCYQISAKMLGGTTLVVSPLISLMKDQLQKLDALGVDAVQVNSSLSREEEQSALEAIAGGSADIVFCTPERLSNPDFLAVLQQARITLAVIDEAHCISHWGHDFRPAYLDMAGAIGTLGRPPILALTATATEDVVADIRRQLNRPGLSVIDTGIYRPNLRYAVTQATSAADKIEHATRLVQQHQGVGIVYAATVKAAEEMHRTLEQAGESVALYHGKMAARERQQNQDWFMNGERRVMVATNAFGMGIDKSDTRFVIHLQIPASLEAYYQESGRAGRDGAAADCILLFLQEDKRVQQFFLVKQYPQAAELKAVHETVKALAAGQPVSFKALADASGDTAQSQLKICLKLLKDGRLLRQNRQLEYLSTSRDATFADYERLAALYTEKQERDKNALEQMVSYAVSGFCRWKLLLDYFGDSSPGFEKCGCCDNCLHPPEALTPIDAIRDDEFEPPAAPAPAPRFGVGTQVRVPKFDLGIVTEVNGDQVSIEFAEHGVRTFLADYVEPA